MLLLLARTACLARKGAFAPGKPTPEAAPAHKQHLYAFTITKLPNGGVSFIPVGHLELLGCAFLPNPHTASTTPRSCFPAAQVGLHHLGQFPASQYRRCSCVVPFSATSCLCRDQASTSCCQALVCSWTLLGLAGMAAWKAVQAKPPGRGSIAQEQSLLQAHSDQKHRGNVW